MRREAVVSDRPAGPGNFSQRLGSQGFPWMDSMQPLRRREEMVLPPDLPMWTKVRMRVGSGSSTFWERLMSGRTEGSVSLELCFLSVFELLLNDDSGCVANNGEVILEECKVFSLFFSVVSELSFMASDGLLTEPDLCTLPR